MVRLTDRPDMTLDVYCGRKTTMQQQQNLKKGFLQIEKSDMNSLIGQEKGQVYKITSM